MLLQKEQQTHNKLSYLLIWLTKYKHTIHIFMWEHLIISDICRCYTATGRCSFHALSLTLLLVSHLQSQSVPFKTPDSLAGYYYVSFPLLSLNWHQPPAIRSTDWVGPCQNTTNTWSWCTLCIHADAWIFLLKQSEKTSKSFSFKNQSSVLFWARARPREFSQRLCV